MLPYALAIVVGLSSSILFVSAFLFKDLHRQDDFLWSGVGLFYALTLWYGSNNIRGSLLLGQLAAVCLISAYFWQVWNLRTAIAKPEQDLPKEGFSVIAFTKNLFKRKSTKKTPPPSKNKQAETKTSEEPKKSAAPKSTPKDSTPKKSAEPKETTTSPVVSTKNMAPSPNLTTETPRSESQTEAPSISNPEQNDSEVIANTDDKNDPAKDPAVETNSNENPAKESPSKQAKSAQTDSSEPPIQEIQAEEITIIEEESNWDDDVEDIDPESITVIEVEAEDPEADEQNQSSN